MPIDTYQFNLNQIFATLVSDSLVTFTEQFTIEEVIDEAKRRWEQIRELQRENYRLKKQLEGANLDDEDGSAGGPTIIEVD